MMSDEVHSITPSSGTFSGEILLNDKRKIQVFWDEFFEPVPSDWRGIPVDLALPALIQAVTAYQKTLSIK